MQHHFFDMDHTIIDNDCDVSWKEFLTKTGRVGPEDRELAALFYADYEQGILDERTFLEFQLRDFRGRTESEMIGLAQEHFRLFVEPLVYEKAQRLIAELFAAGHAVYLLTATNRVIATPVARHFGIERVLATELAVEAGRYTGSIAGIYCLGEGKRQRLEQHCAAAGLDVSAVFYYGDSVSDIPVLRRVGHPVATNPSPRLRETARCEGWRILDFRA